MHQIVYMSLAMPGFTEQMLDQVGEASRRRNACGGLTGLLLFDGHRFLQALEGGEADVSATMRRIGSDQRHSRIIVVANRTIAARQFGGWSMDSRRYHPGSCPESFLSQVRSSVKDVADPSLRATVIGFASLSVRQETHAPARRAAAAGSVGVTPAPPVASGG